MIRALTENLEIVRLSQIDSNDRLFQISLPWLPLDELIRSITQSGVLSPLRLHRVSPGEHRVISGFRRHAAAGRAGLQQVPCFVTSDDDTLRLFRQALEDNVTSRPLHPLEKAAAVSKLRRSFQVSDPLLLEEYLPLLGIPADRFHLQRYLNLASLPQSLQTAITKNLQPETALKLQSWTNEEQDFFITLVFKFHLGKNKQRRLFSLLDEIRALLLNTALSPNQSGGSVVTIWHTSGAAQVEQDEGLPLPERYNQALGRLLQLRFPRLSEYETRYRALKAGLKLPPQIQLHAPPYFEGSQIRVSFSAANPEEFSNLLETLREIGESNELRKIFDLL